MNSMTQTLLLHLAPGDREPLREQIASQLRASASVVSSGVTMPISSAGSMNSASTRIRLVLRIDSASASRRAAVSASRTTAARRTAPGGCAPAT